MKAVLCLAALMACASGAVLQHADTLNGWDHVSRADGSKLVRVHFAMKMSGRTELELLRNGDPASPSFRNWASPEHARAIRESASTAPTVAWLSSANIDHYTVGDVVTAHMTVAQAEKLFRTTIHTVKSQADGRQWHHAEDLHAPETVAATVDAVFGLHGLPLPKVRTQKKDARDTRAARGLQNSPNVGPTDLRTRYHVTGRGSGSTSNRQAVAEFQGQFANPQDLTLFFQNLVPNAQPGDDTVYAYKGNQASGYGIEALLDIEYIMGVAPGIKTEFWGWQNFDFCTDLKNWTTTIISDQNPPNVFSVSYGWQGDLSQIGCTTSEVNSIDNDFKTISNRGITIIFASGDSGSAYDGTQLWPSWPASSPWVTAVGSTCFTDSSMQTEEASTQFGSGSGFSAQFTVPDFQRKAVTAYLQAQGSSNLPPSGVWTRGGRATADVSALGEGFQVYVDGSVEIVGGTSAAAPTFAAVISLLNDKSLAQTGKPLGWLNPWIYANPGYFTDITLGSDKIDRGGNQLQYGFNTAPGWDPPTGMGTPRFDLM